MYGNSDGDTEHHRRRRRKRRRHDHGKQLFAEGGWGNRGFQPRIDPQRETETVGFLNANYPEKAHELERLKAASPEYYGRALSMLSQRVRFLQMTQERNPEHFKEALTAMKRRDGLWSQTRHPLDSVDATSVRSRLHTAVDQICDLGEPVPPMVAGSFVAIAASLAGWLFYRRRKQAGPDIAGNPDDRSLT